MFCFCFFSFEGVFKGQVRWPKGPPHLALNPPYVFLVCFVFVYLFSFLCFNRKTLFFPPKKCKRSRDHIMASLGSSQKVFSVRGPCTLRTQIIISLTSHHLQKFDFRHHLILPVFISLPLRDFGFSSPVIVIVKIHFDI